ncbi:MAG: hypothetical protein NT013_01700 [Planctomycetia bacterium]|nr:hypothetical protein [Planctomycetia bacterium]
MFQYIANQFWARCTELGFATDFENWEFVANIILNSTIRVCWEDIFHAQT